MIAGLKQTLDRISEAQDDSPIAVFTGADNYGNPALLSLFANTVKTDAMLDSPELIGIYSNGSDIDIVKKELSRALK